MSVERVYCVHYYHYHIGDSLRLRANERVINIIPNPEAPEEESSLED
ncbi:MAG: hypothetical protein LBD60_01355 [Puniceicoccales bacterium]|jgi:hypothetical protein|nr:hypothetical protein [Puniceicoccales bacterium]